MRSIRCVARLLMGLCFVAGSSWGVEVSIDPADVSVGFPIGFTPPAARSGHWMPITLAAEVLGTQPAEVELRVGTADRDGDRVDYVVRRTLTPGIGKQRLWVYATPWRMPGFRAAEPGIPTTVEVYDAENAVRIASVPLPRVNLIETDAQVILDVSAAPVSALDALYRPYRDLNFFEPGWGEREHYQKIYGGQIRAEDIPPVWYGLEGVDVVVWDRPDPANENVRPAQLEALGEWVRAGGQLIIGIGDVADRLAREPELSALSPFELRGGVRAVSRMAAFARANEEPIAVANVALKPNAQLMLSDTLDGRRAQMIGRWSVGSGRVTAVAASLNDLFPAGVAASHLGRLVDFNTHTDAYRESEGQFSVSTLREPQRVFDALASVVDYSATGSVLAMVATIFVVLYIVGATFVSWVWLKRKGQTAWGWPAFAAFAVVASFLSLGAVRLGHGVTSSTKAAALVDLEAGEFDAVAACWFGHRSVSRVPGDFWLPTQIEGDQRSARNYLRPLTPGGRYTSYATPLRFRALVSEARLVDAPLRSTLKQFEGFWRGQMDGTVRGRIFLDRGTGLVAAESWIANDLPHDVVSGYLLYLDPRLTDATQAAGATARYSPLLSPVPPAVNVLAVRLAAMAAGEMVRGVIGTGERDELAERRARWDALADKSLENYPEPANLWAQQRDWANTFLGGGLSFESAAALASTHRLYLASGTSYDAAGTAITMNGMIDRDVSHWLTPTQAVLLLFTADAGPAVLYRDGDALRATGQTLYRVRCPVQVSGAAPQLPEISP